MNIMNVVKISIDKDKSILIYVLIRYKVKLNAFVSREYFQLCSEFGSHRSDFALIGTYLLISNVAVICGHT